jgi:hypothetical protein
MEPFQLTPESARALALRLFSQEQFQADPKVCIIAALNWLDAAAGKSAPTESVKPATVNPLSARVDALVKAKGLEVVAEGIKGGPKEGHKQEETTFIDVTLWSRTAEVASQYLHKGSPVFLEGRLQLDTWEQNQKRSGLRVIGENLQLLAKREGVEVAHPLMLLLLLVLPLSRRSGASQPQLPKRPCSKPDLDINPF